MMKNNRIISSPKRQVDSVKLKQKDRHGDTEKQDLKNSFNKDEINANQALSSIKRMSSPISTYSRINNETKYGKSKMRDIFFSDQAFIELI